MLVVQMYRCEICDSIYENEKEAVDCESRGEEFPLAEVGQKVSFRDDWNGGFGTCYIEMDIIGVCNKGHYIEYILGRIEDLYPFCDVNGNDEFNDLCRIIPST